MEYAGTSTEETKPLRKYIRTVKLVRSPNLLSCTSTTRGIQASRHAETDLSTSHMTIMVSGIEVSQGSLSPKHGKAETETEQDKYTQFWCLLPGLNIN
jgi:hypothetical protein